ncbi:MAG: FAD-dependent oxidoreductase [Bacillota bacterium]|nr:FAD-dependent oxidoreductase [Bacillota bacterium]
MPNGRLSYRSSTAILIFLVLILGFIMSAPARAEGPDPDKVAIAVEEAVYNPWPPAPPERTEVYDLVVYGGGFAGCATVIQASDLLPPEQKIALVVPESALGSIGTVGGMNFFDLRRWHGRSVAGGSFARWFVKYGQGYPTAEMARTLYKDVVDNSRGRMQIYFRHEIENVAAADGVITHIDIRPVQRDPADLAVKWAGPALRLTGKVFIDASDNGRLTRLAGVPVTTGRFDRTGDNHQQPATLMFKVRGIDVQAALAYRNALGRPDFFYVKDGNGSWLGWGGQRSVWLENPIIQTYNARRTPFTLKAYNIAEDEPGTWWVNALVIHGVDGRLQQIDRGTPHWPQDSPPGTWDIDTAYREAVAEVQSPAFLAALRSLPGFSGVELVRRPDGSPVVGEILYLRETIHAVTDADAVAPGTSNTNYALTPAHVRGAGPDAFHGLDRENYPWRVGLGFYLVDLHGYLKNDPTENHTLKSQGEAVNPYYVPYAALTTPYAANLLLPGYAQRTADEAWGAARVIPNLTVCGDAAGVAAAHSLATGRPVNAFTYKDVLAVRDTLRARGARVDK